MTDFVHKYGKDITKEIVNKARSIWNDRSQQYNSKREMFFMMADRVMLPLYEKSTTDEVMAIQVDLSRLFKQICPKEPKLISYKGYAVWQKNTKYIALNPAGRGIGCYDTLPQAKACITRALA